MLDRPVDSALTLMMCDARQLNGFTTTFYTLSIIGKRIRLNWLVIDQSLALKYNNILR